MKYVLFTFLFMLSYVSFGQTKEVDSLNVMEFLNESAKESDTTIQLQKFKKALILSKELKFNYGIYASHKEIANWKKIKYNIDSSIVEYKRGIRDLPNSNIYNYYLYELIGKEFMGVALYDSSLYYYNKVIKLGEKIPKKSIIARGYMNIGSMWFQKFEHDKAFKNYALADSICESEPKLRISVLRAQINNYLGYSVRVTHGYEKSIEYYNISKQLHKELKNEFGVQEINIAIAQAEISLKNYDKALKLLNESIEYHKKEAPTANSYSYGIIVRGFLLSKMKKFKEAEKDYKLYYDLAVKSKNKTYQRWGLAYLGEFYANTNRLQESISYHKKAIKECKEVDDFGKELETTKSLIEVYKKNNDLALALETYEEYIALKKKIDEKEITEKTYALETKYQTEKKEHEIELLKSQNELAEHQKIIQRNQLLGGIVLTSFAGLFFFFLYKNRQKTNTKLKQLDTLKSNFFANISHEFRTPLTLISAPIQDALNDNSLTEKKRSQFEMILRNSQRLLSLVDQLLELSKIDAEHLKLHIQEGNVLLLISGLTDSFSYLAEQKEINYHKNIKMDAIQVWFDKDAIEKIVVNLLANAIKYTPNAGSIVCNTFVTEGKLYLEVKNTGKGLLPEELSTIFQRFYQTNEQNQGSGIGLALVKGLITLHKGTIIVESNNEWTTFNVMLPVKKSNFNSEQFIVIPRDKLKLNIPIISNSIVDVGEEFSDNELPILLIAEDNADLRTLLKQNFEASYNVITAPNGKVGVALALEHIPDLIISDIMMPIKDGIALTNELKNDERTSHIPIILLTAKAGDENKIEGIKTGADDYITKPFNSELLRLKVDNLIENRKQLQKRYSQEVILTLKDIAINSVDKFFLERVQTIFEERIIESDFNAETFSSAVGMSRMQLHRKLKALTGLTTSEFIRSQRLKLAATLLKKSDVNISQIGYSVGFNDHAYFSKSFKKMYKCTPSEYAHKNK